MRHGWRTASAHPLLRASILLGFTILIVRLIVTGEMLLYIVPSLMIYVKLAAGGLLLLSCTQLYIGVMSLKRPAAVCGCAHDHDHGHSHEPPKSWSGNAFLYGLFLMPLLLGAIVPNTALAGSLAQNKGMNLGGAAISGQGASGPLAELDGDIDPELKKMFKTSVYNRDYAKLGIALYQQDQIEMKDEWFIEKLQAMNTFVDNFQGKPITITGFVYRDPALSSNQFIIGRMAMTHCIADISPYGIVAESADAAQYPDDSWITVTGSIDQIVFQGQKVIQIHVESIQPASKPEIPYVYPDWNFASKL